MQSHVLPPDWAVPIHLYGISQHLQHQTDLECWSNPSFVMTVWWATLNLSLNYTLWAEVRLSEAEKADPDTDGSLV